MKWVFNIETWYKAIPRRGVAFGRSIFRTDTAPTP